MLARAHSWLDRHPGAGDAGLAAVLLAFCLTTLSSGRADAGPSDVVFTVSLIAPLALRRRRPVGVFAAVMVLCGLELVLQDDFLAANGAVLVALYTLVAYAPRRLAAAGFAIAATGALLAALHFRHDFTVTEPLVTWLVILVHLTLAAALGDRAHARVRDREALRERARLLALERDQQAAIATAAERNRIARELHDVVAHSLAVVIAQADGGRYAAEQDPRAATAALTTISATAREAQAEMRRALGVLGREPDAALRPQPGVGDVPALVARLGEAGLPVTLVQEGEAQALPPATGMTAYRVVQEALTNVLKHAGPRASAAVTLAWAPGRLTLVVRDDGAGPHAGADGRGRGLTGMRERVEARGGTVTAGPAPRGGFEVRAVIPAEPARARAGTRA